MSEATGASKLATFARVMSECRDELVDELLVTTRVRIKALDVDWPMVQLLEASIAENIVSGLNFLANETPLATVDAPTSAIAYARMLAQREVPLSALARSYRIGHARFLDVAMSRLVTLPEPDRTPTLVSLVERSLRFIDKVVLQVEMAYEQERDRWMSSRGGLRQRWVAQVLDGSADVAEAESVLRYRLEALHLAVEIWPDPDVPTRDVLTLFDETARIIAPGLGAVGAPLLIPTGERQARMWFAVRDDRPIDGSALAAALSERGKRARLAIGSPAHGVRGFRRTLEQAGRVQVIAEHGGDSIPRVLTYSRVEPLALLAGDFDGLRTFVRATLGDLAGPDPRNDWLRETLREFLARDRSYSATAASMTLHRNTIQYRVQQAAELCGVDLEDRDRALEVQIALYAVHWLGPAVLSGNQMEQRKE